MIFFWIITNFHAFPTKSVQYQNSGQTMAVFPETEPDSKNASFYATKAVDIWFEQADKNGERHGYMDMINHYHRSDP